MQASAQQETVRSPVESEPSKWIHGAQDGMRGIAADLAALDQITPPCVRYGVATSGMSKPQMRSQISGMWR